jgi:hypothetical protein
MQSISVKDAKGKQRRITVMNSWDLLYSIPIFLITCINQFLIKPIYNSLYGLMALPTALLVGHPLKLKAKGFWLIMFMSCLALCTGIALTFMNMSDTAYGYITIGVYLTSASYLVLALVIFQGPDDAPYKNHLSDLSEVISDHLVPSNLSKPVIFTNMFITLFIAVHLLVLVILPDYSLFYWVCCVPVIQMFLMMDKENVEHLASHSPDGRTLIDKKAKSVKDKIIVAIENLRVYVVWPMAYWMPDYYYCSHTGIHHFENNGPADFQSTLRFNHTRISGVINAVTWYGLFTHILPFEIANYLRQGKNKKQFNRFVKGFAMGFAVFAAFVYFFPAVALVVCFSLITSGMGTYLFVMRWHGFHDARFPYSVEASNSSPLHYGHHKKMGVHLRESNLLARLYWQQKDEGDYCAPVFCSNTSFSSFENNFMLVLSMFWQEKFWVIKNLVHTESTNPGYLKRLVSGSNLSKSSESFRNIDRWLSLQLGSVLERIGRWTLSDEHQHFFKPKGDIKVEEVRITNFAKPDEDTGKPMGIF